MSEQRHEHLPRVEELPDGRLQATCPACGWVSMPNRYRNTVEWERRRHGTVEACERRNGGHDRRG